MFHMGASVQSPRCKSQLTTALLFPLKDIEKGIREETTWRNTCTMSLSCNCCWCILWDYFILSVVSAIRHLSKLKCHTVAKKKRQLRLVNLVESWNATWMSYRNMSLIFWWILTCSGSILTQHPINLINIPSFLRAFGVMASFYVRRKSSHDTIDIVTLMMQLYIDCKYPPWRAEAIQSWSRNVRISQTCH